MLDPTITPDMLVVFTRQHLMFVFDATVREIMLARLDEAIDAIMVSSDLFVVKRYKTITTCQQFVGDVLTFCNAQSPIRSRRTAGGV